MSNKPKLIVSFAVPVEAVDSKSVRGAYKEMRKQIVDFANALNIDQNILITHSVVSSDMKDAVPVDVKIAELQTINKKITSGKSSLDDPKQTKSIVVSEKVSDDDEEAPRIKTISDWQPSNVRNTPASKPTLEIKSASVSIMNNNPNSNKEVLIAAVFKDLKKTSNSVAIVEFLTSKPDQDLSIEDIVKGSKLEKATVAAWLAQTGKTVKAVTKADRGVYRFDSSKVSI